MKKVIRQSFRMILIKHLFEFALEKDKSVSTVEHYADHAIEEFDRYLKAYNEFKED